MHTVDIYIDTSIKGPRRRAGSYMYILAVKTNAGPADVGNTEHLENTTENQATLLALEAALKRLNKPSQLSIHLECSYVAAALQNGWFKQWQQQGWKNAKDKPVCDAEIWQSIEYLLNVHEFEVCLRTHHSYRDWMQRELSKK